MGCGCRSTRAVAGQWEHTPPADADGPSTPEPYATEWEARGAAEQSGGTYRWREGGQQRSERATSTPVIEG